MQYLPEMRHITLTKYGEGNLVNQNIPDMASNVYLEEPFRLHHMIVHKDMLNGMRERKRKVG